MDICHRLRYLRQLRGYTVEDLARLSDIPRATLYRYESGDVDGMSIDRIEPLAKALSVTPAYLMGWNIVNASYAEDDSAINRVMQTGVIKAKVMEKDPERESFTTQLRKIGVFAFEGCPMPDCAVVVDTEDMGGSSLCTRCVVFVSQRYDFTSGGLYVVMYNSMLRVRKYYAINEGVVLTSMDPKVPPKFFNKLAMKKLKIVGEVIGIQYLIK